MNPDLRVVATAPLALPPQGGYGGGLDTALQGLKVDVQAASVSESTPEPTAEFMNEPTSQHRNEGADHTSADLPPAAAVNTTADQVIPQHADAETPEVVPLPEGKLVRLRKKGKNGTEALEGKARNKLDTLCVCVKLDNLGALLVQACNAICHAWAYAFACFEQAAMPACVAIISATDGSACAVFRLHAMSTLMAGPSMPAGENPCSKLDLKDRSLECCSSIDCFCHCY